jgi:ATP-dependent RNA helicase
MNTTETTSEQKDEPEPQVQRYTTWDSMGLKDELLRGIYSYGFEVPSEIQQKAIMPVLQGRDVIGQAQSGTGKTGTFSIGVLQRIDLTKDDTQAIVLLPTHELVNQVYDAMRSLGDFMTGLRIKTMVGGTNIGEDTREISNAPPHVIIGCTGRIYDMIRRRALSISNLKMLVMDEADEMLGPGFKDQIYNIFQVLPIDTQTAVFSATMSEQVLKLTEKFMRDPVKIIMKPEELTLDGIEQYFVALQSDSDKFEMLKSIFHGLSLSQSIIYANSLNRVVELYNAMIDEGFSVCALHSGMAKQDRENVMREFRQGIHRVMISSNLTARGIDIQQVNVVINFDIPRSVDTYLHRIGRSGRWGRKGKSINFVTKQDIYTMKNIERHYKISIAELPVDFTF